MALFDNHTHLNNERIIFMVDEVIKSSGEVGVEYFITNGTYENDWPHVADLSQKYSQVLPCFGIHPWYVKSRSRDWLPKLSDFVLEHCAGIGETGLDYADPKAGPDEQEEVFKSHVRLAKDLDVPFVVHCRKAWDRLLGILNKLKPYPAGFMVHGFSGSEEVAARLFSFGGYVSVSTVLLRPNHEKLLQLFSILPVDRILTESDTPDFSPDAGIPNSPKNLRALTALIANSRNMSVVNLENQLWQNSCNLWAKIIQAKTDTPDK